MGSKIHIGCGNNYLTGWINIDNNKNVKADMYCDINKKLPFGDNSVDEIITEGTVEHIKREKIFQFYDEIWRICKPGARVKILTNHFSSVWAFQHFNHNTYYGVSSFDIMRPEECFNGERYNKARFQIEKIKLFVFYPKLVNHPILAKLPINWFFNFSLGWQRAMEKIFAFDGISYILRVVK